MTANSELWVFEVKVAYRNDDTWWTTINTTGIMLSVERLARLRDTLTVLCEAIAEWDVGE